jgi:hypothetical protein
MAHYATRRPARFASRFLALCDFCHACPLYHCSGGREVPSWDGLQLHQLSVEVAIASGSAGPLRIANYALDWL